MKQQACPIGKQQCNLHVGKGEKTRPVNKEDWGGATSDLVKGPCDLGGGEKIHTQTTGESCSWHWNLGFKSSPTVLNVNILPLSHKTTSHVRVSSNLAI